MKTTLSTLLLLLAGLASADVTGSVSLSDGRPAKLAVVFLEGGEKKPRPLAHALIDQKGKKFLPHVLAVPVGTTVEFPNSDTVFHNVFAEYQAKRFDLGMYPRGSSRKQKFERPGLVALFCSIHSDMSAFVMVVDTPYYTVADSKGVFSIKDVPSGTYKLKVWHESGELSLQTVTVEDNGKPIFIRTKRS